MRCSLAKLVFRTHEMRHFGVLVMSFTWKGEMSPSSCTRHAKGAEEKNREGGKRRVPRNFQKRGLRSLIQSLSTAYPDRYILSASYVTATSNSYSDAADTLPGSSRQWRTSCASEKRLKIPNNNETKNKRGNPATGSKPLEIQRASNGIKKISRPYHQ